MSAEPYVQVTAQLHSAPIVAANVPARPHATAPKTGPAR